MLDFNDVPCDTVPYLANQKQSIDLPTDLAISHLRCKLAGRAKISGGASSGTPWTENPLTLIDNIRVFGSKAGGAVEIINIDAANLYQMVHLLQGTAGSISIVNSGAAASYDFNADILIPFAVIGNKIAEHWKALTLLPAWLFSDLKLEIKWKDGTLTAGGGMISGGDRAVAISSYGSDGGVPSVATVAIQARNVDKAKHRPMLMKLYKKMCVTEAAETAHREKLNKGNYYRGFMFRTYTDTNERPLTDAIVNNIQIKIGSEPKKDWSFGQLKDDNKSFYNVETMPTGYALIDFCKTGTLKTMLDTRKYNDKGTSFEAVLNVSGAAGNRVDIVSMEVMDSGDW